MRGCERREELEEEVRSVLCSLEVPAKNKNPALRIWGKATAKRREESGEGTETEEGGGK